MFIESHKDNDIVLTFLPSSQVNAYPCGRRRSTQIDADRNDSTTGDIYYIPFDPEARLNTEANNRKHSSLNGFTQTYLQDWNQETKVFTLSLGGYLFNITLDDTYLTSSQVDNKTIYTFNTDVFGDDIVDALVNKIDALIAEAKDKNDTTGEQNCITEKNAVTNAARIYANILLEDTHLFSAGFGEYYTSVLRNQSAGPAQTSLDLLKTGGSVSASADYYFSGLSFSTEPLTKKAGEITHDSKLQTAIIDGNSVNQQIVSLCILEKEGSSWIIHQPALLPKIDHGTTEDSIVVYGDTTLKGNGKKLTVEGTTELTGDTTIKSNLKVDKNINVGALTDIEKATDAAGGYIVAKNDITTKQNLYVDVDATVKNSLVVGDRAEEDSTEAGTITAKKHVETPTLNASTSITTPLINVTNTDGTANANIDNVTVIKKLTVHNDTEGGALAELDNAIIYGTLTVNNNNNDAKIVTDTLEVTGTHTAKGKIDATIDLGDTNNIDAAKANITSLTGATAVINNITGTTKVSSAEFIQNGSPVPIIDVVEQTDGYWQLQLTRVSIKSKS